MLELYGTALRSRLLLGTARFPSPAVLTAAVRASRAEVVTVALRRESGGERAGQGFWSIIRELGVRVLPNTAGCHSVREAVSTAHMAREVFATAWIKLEVIGEEDTLQPDVLDRKSTRLNSSHEWISYAVFCLKKKKKIAYAPDHTRV